jgi:acyl-CoA thioesterase
MNDLDIARQCRDTMYGNDLASQDLGITVDIPAPGKAEARLEVRRNMVNGHDICHGGYIFTLADTAFAFACNTYNQVTVAASASIEFVRPARLGDELQAKASEAHRGGRMGVYDVVVSRQDGEVIAIFRGRSYATREPMISI